MLGDDGVGECHVGGPAISCRLRSGSANDASIELRASVAEVSGPDMASLDHRVEVVVDVATEVRRVVRIDGHLEPALQHRRNGCEAMLFNYLQADVRQRAHGQRHLILHEAPDELVILEAPIAVVDPLDAPTRRAPPRCSSGGPSSPAWATRCRPSARARWNTLANFDGGWPTSAESRPTPMNGASRARTASRVAIADSSLSSRRNATMSPLLSPWSATTRTGAGDALHDFAQRDPRDVCACGLRKTSACRTPAARARSR